ncbi:endonuclease/exonuclease/phosphatase family protein [Rhizobium phaseoli]|uniref:endonuclease/exonuclease/phosphatase family protein n=1 Tax=Rhizobium phaseoli TaxID=396 RepID=UPI0012370ED1|nr:endonuclease/exonuclease/phosphatase family protein [Rhizobium phaseoli]
MLAIAFWNVHKARGANMMQGVVSLAAAIAANQAWSGPDGEVLMCLSEPGTLDENVLRNQLNLIAPGHTWWCEKSFPERFITLGTIDRATLSFSGQKSGCLPATVSRVNGHNVISPYELWFVHLTSPINADDASGLQTAVARELREAVKEREILRSNSATIAIGDFNMSPYSRGMTDPTTLNAAACRTAAKGTRTVRSSQHNYFFNPMWEILGSRTADQQPGSFYRRYDNSAIFWHLYDQVLVRPELVDRVVPDSPWVMTTAGTCSLLTPRGAMDSRFSDHLPIAISLEI